MTSVSAMMPYAMCAGTEALLPFTVREALALEKPSLDEEGNVVKSEEGKILYKGKIPDIRAVNAALEYMVNEGEEILAEREGRQPNLFSRETIARRVDISPANLADQLHDEFNRCFRIKNEKTTQNQTKTKEEESS